MGSFPAGRLATLSVSCCAYLVFSQALVPAIPVRERCEREAV